MGNHHFTATRTMVILHNMGKEKGKPKEKNTLERENVVTRQMGIVK